MLAYWFLFLVPALAAITEKGRGLRPSGAPGLPGLGHGWPAAMIALIIFIGCRLEVGGDWFNYFAYLDEVSGRSFSEILAMSDPGYQLLNWISVEFGWGVVGVNLMGAAIFTTGLGLFCRSLPRPWLALAVAVPYLVIVVGMGYTRQGIALALAMIGLVALRQKSTFRFVLWIMIGATFHKTAVLLLPIGALAHSEGRILRFVWIGVATATAYFLFLEDSVDTLRAGYIDAEYQSEGAMIRLMMNAAPATLLLTCWKRFKRLPHVSEMWRSFSWVSIALFLVLFGTSASTAVDRVALYMLPLQLVVFSSLPDAFRESNTRTQTWVNLVILYYAIVLLVWLVFANHSQYWMPYKFYPFGS